LGQFMGGVEGIEQITGNPAFDQMLLMRLKVWMLQMEASRRRHDPARDTVDDTNRERVEAMEQEIWNRSEGLYGDMVAQSAPVKEAEEKSKSGIISSTLNAVSGAAAIVANIPALPATVSIGSKAIAAGAGLASRLFKSFGYSKPISVAALQPFNNRDSENLSSGSGLTNSYKLAIDPENVVNSDPSIYGRPMDEHDLYYLARKPGLINTGSFTSSAAVGTILWQWNVRPFTGATYADTTAPVANHFTFLPPCAAIASQFKYWDGDMKLSVEFICSKFHTGKIQLSWFPTNSEVPASPISIEDSTNIIHEVFDFCGDTVINKDIPFLKDFMLAKVGNTTGTTGEQYYNGTLVCSVASPIVCNTTVVGDSIVYYNVYAAAGEHMNFHCPISSQVPTGGTAYRYYVSNQGGTIPTGGTWGYVGFSGPVDGSLNARFEAEFPPLISAKHHKVEMVCSGDKICNVKQLTNRFRTFTTGTFTGNGQQVYIDPLAFKVVSDDPFSLFSAWAYYQKGSYNYKIWQDYTSANFVNAAYQAFLAEIDNGTTINTAAYNNYTGNGISRDTMLVKRSVDASIPYYNQNPFIHGQYLYITDEREQVTLGFQFDPLAPGSNGYKVLWATGDDFSFGWFEGTPILYYGPTAPPSLTMVSDPTVGNRPGGKPALSFKHEH